MLAMFIALILGLVAEVKDDSVFEFEVVVVSRDGVRGVDTTYNYPDHDDIHWPDGVPMVLTRTITNETVGDVHTMTDTVRVVPLDHGMMDVIKTASTSHEVIGEQYAEYLKHDHATSLRYAAAHIMFIHGMGDPVEGDTMAIVSHMNAGKYGWTAVVHLFE
jgi:hypothetical protein